MTRILLISAIAALQLCSTLAWSPLSAPTAFPAHTRPLARPRPVSFRPALRAVETPPKQNANKESAEAGKNEDFQLLGLKSGLDLDGDGVITLEELQDAPLLSQLAEIDTFREALRPYRRTVFGHPQWEASRSQSRWKKTLATTTEAWVAKTVWLQVLATGAVATTVVLYNDYLGGATQGIPFVGDLMAQRPMLTLPALPFTLASPALSLLLVFRTNQAYDRWWEARKVWGSVINTCRDLSRQVIARVPPEQEELKRLLVGQSIGFARTLTFHLRKPTPQENTNLKEHMVRLLGEPKAQEIMGSTHKPMTIMTSLTHNLEGAGLNAFDKTKVDKEITGLINDLGKCERIFKTPIPLVYTRHSSRFLGVWMLALPLALYNGLPNHWSAVPISCLIAFFQFGIDELAIEVEEPFSILPMEAMSDGIEASCMEALELEKVRNSR